VSPLLNLRPPSIRSDGVSGLLLAVWLLISRVWTVAVAVTVKNGGVIHLFFWFVVFVFKHSSRPLDQPTKLTPFFLS
jgi:hypothetical protein